MGFADAEAHEGSFVGLFSLMIHEQNRLTSTIPSCPNATLSQTNEIHYGALFMLTTPPANPAGPFAPVENYNEAVSAKLIDAIREAPAHLRAAVAGLNDGQLDTRYKNWTIRQISHHIADSHLHSVIRFKWALTEEHPTIKAYEEGDWVELADCKRGDIEPALALFDGLHSKWVQILESLTPQQFERTFLHPQTGDSVRLWSAMNYYAWHGRHHTAQILWLRAQHGW
jgi:uncharacterized damage-inducible protein DinB